MSKTGFLTLGGLLLLGSTGVAWFSLRGPAAPLYETAVVARGNIEATVAAVGTLQPRLRVDVGAQVSGQILRIHVQAGDVVEKGRLLIEIDASVHQATVDAGRAALEGLRAQLAEEEAQWQLAEQQFEWQERLSRDGVAREEDLRTARTQRDAAAARLRQRRAGITERESTLKGEEALLGYTRIYAPISGTVVSLEAKEGQTLNATYQTPTVLRIADLKAMTVWTAVAEADIHRVKPGMPASFSTLGNDGRRWMGTVRQVLPMPPVAGPHEAPPTEFGKVVQYTVLFDVENDDGFLLPQMTAQVSVLTDSAQGVLVAPLAGLTPEEGVTDVFRARILGPDDRAAMRMVRAGKRDRRAAEVLEGLSEGDRLILRERRSETLKR
ncbi:MAG: efflux RND transporter periplasmic adaptor subunit, partial [Verrucomicrobiae bacterium]|nr:efflux RND transporter periplasmic adaptor subunit [Verrucomicrobiae bacterium]